MQKLRRIDVRHACGCLVTYQHDLPPFILSRWLERAAEERCRRCEDLPLLPREGRSAKGGQLALF
jgi:hypothetical protein